MSETKKEKKLAEKENELNKQIGLLKLDLEQYKQIGIQYQQEVNTLRNDVLFLKETIRTLNSSHLKIDQLAVRLDTLSHELNKRNQPVSQRS